MADDSGKTQFSIDLEFNSSNAEKGLDSVVKKIKQINKEEQSVKKSAQQSNDAMKTRGKLLDFSANRFLPDNFAPFVKKATLVTGVLLSIKSLVGKILNLSKDAYKKSNTFYNSRLDRVVGTAITDTIHSLGGGEREEVEQSILALANRIRGAQLGNMGDIDLFNRLGVSLFDNGELRDTHSIIQDIYSLIIKTQDKVQKELILSTVGLNDVASRRVAMEVNSYTFNQESRKRLRNSEAFEAGRRVAETTENAKRAAYYKKEDVQAATVRSFAATARYFAATARYFAATARSFMDDRSSNGPVDPVESRLLNNPFIDSIKLRQQQAKEESEAIKNAVSQETNNVTDQLTQQTNNNKNVIYHNNINTSIHLEGVPRETASEMGKRFSNSLLDELNNSRNKIMGS